MGVLGSLIANCTVLSLSLVLPPWAAPASVPLLPASAGPLLPTSSRLPAFYFCAVCVLGKKILALAGVGLFASTKLLSTRKFSRAFAREQFYSNADFRPFWCCFWEYHPVLFLVFGGWMCIIDMDM